MTAIDRSTTTTTARPARTTPRIGFATSLAVGLLAFATVGDALALPGEPFSDDLIGWSFDPNTPWTPPEPVDPGDPGDLPPLYATSPAIDGRTDRSITLSFHSSSADAVGVALERSAGRDGKFENVRCWNTTVRSDSLDTVTTDPVKTDGVKTDGVKTDGVKTDTVKGGTDALSPKRAVDEKRGGADVGDNGCENGAFPPSVVDAGLPRDTLFCYRTRVWDATGTSVTSPSRCAYTRGFAGEEAGDPAIEPWRGRLIVETGDLPYAGTDDDVRIGLNDHWNNTTPHGNATWLDYRHDDFEPGARFAYDLDLTTLEDIDDVTLLSIFKDGTDDWCVAGVRLEMDRDVVFQRDFSGEPGGCRWIGDDEALTFPHEELRASPDWQSFVSIGPGFTIEGADIMSRVESAVGNLAHHTELYWDEEDDGVWLSRVDDQMFHVEIETTASADNWVDPTVRIDLDVGVEIDCAPSPTSGFDVTIGFVPQNAHASAEGVLFEVGEFFSCGLDGEWNCIEEALNDQLLDALPTFDGASFHVAACPRSRVDENGSVSFDF